MAETRITAKQHEALQLLARGYTSKEIAKIVGVSASAIDQRIDCVAKAVGADNRRVLARWYLDASQRDTAVSAQVASNIRSLPCSVSDQKGAEVAGQITERVTTPSNLIVVPVPETWSARSVARQMLEGALLIVMIAWGFGALVEKLT